MHGLMEKSKWVVEEVLVELAEVELMSHIPAKQHAIIFRNEME